MTRLELAEFAIKSAVIQQLGLNDVPWDLLGSASLRRKLLLNPEPFSQVETLDPIRMSHHDLYGVLALLLQAQGSGVQLLEFSMAGFFHSDADVEQGVNTPGPPTASPRAADTTQSRSSTVDLDNDTSESDSPTTPPRDNSTYDDGIGLQLLESPRPILSALATPASSVIDKPPSFPPLSESIIKAAIENVAGAGYLSIDVPNPLPQSETVSQQSDVVKINNSNSKKRSREEMEEGREKQKKKYDKVPVPTREQSSRYYILNIFIHLADASFPASKMPTTKTSTSLSALVRLNSRLMRVYKCLETYVT